MSQINLVTAKSEYQGIPLFDGMKNRSTAVGHDSLIIANICDSYLANLACTATDLLSAPQIKFHNLRLQWENDIQFLSSTTAISMHPAYQQIIGMGKDAIPFIMIELAEKPKRWFWALKAITGEDPVDPSKRGKVKEMASAWLIWWSHSKNNI